MVFYHIVSDEIFYIVFSFRRLAISAARFLVVLTIFKSVKNVTFLHIMTYIKENKQIALFLKTLFAWAIYHLYTKYSLKGLQVCLTQSRAEMSGEFDSRKDLHSTKFEQRPQMFVRFQSCVIQCLHPFDNMTIIH